MFKHVAAYTAALAVGASMATFFVFKHDAEIKREREAYVIERSQETDKVAEQVEVAFRAFYQGLRTMAALPGVRTIDRYGETFSPDAKQTMQEVYNNTYMNVTLSEVYLLPATLDPDKTDPHTHKGEEPILTFDEFIVAGAAKSGEDKAKESENPLEEEEVYEYRLMREQLGYLAAHYPSKDKVSDLDVPAVTGKPVITCDNSEFTRADLEAHNDKPRMGLVYTVPVFGLDGKFRGGVSGIVRLNVLEKLIPQGGYALADTATGYVGSTEPTQTLEGSLASFKAGHPDTSRIFSQMRTLKIKDRDPWQLWVSLPDSQFWAQRSVLQANFVFHGGLWATGFVTLVLLGVTHLLLRNQAVLQERVAQKTRELAGRNASMRRILDHAEQGFCTVTPEGIAVGDHSLAIEKWFGKPNGMPIAAVLFGHAPSRARANFEAGWDQIAADVLPFELSVDQLPKNIERDDRTFAVALTPIRDEAGVLRNLLVVVSDITDRLVVERQEFEGQELVAVAQALTRDRSEFLEFYAETSRAVREIYDAADHPDRTYEFRLIHTLKGNCGQMGIVTFASLLHEIETMLVDEDRAPSGAERERLLNAWAKFQDRVTALVGERSTNVIELEEAEFAKVLEQVRMGVSNEVLAKLIERWRFDPVKKRLGRLATWTQSLAVRLGLPEVGVEVDADDTRIDKNDYKEVWSNMTHLVRNALGHAFPPSRESSEPPRITFRAQSDATSLTISVTDNGTGIDWEAVRKSAFQRGLPHASKRDLIDAVFSDGVSTQEVANELAGRGVGMGSLRQAVVHAGGSIALASVRGRGTTVTITLPLLEVEAVPESGPRLSMSEQLRRASVRPPSLRPASLRPASFEPVTIRPAPSEALRALVASMSPAADDEPTHDGESHERADERRVVGATQGAARAASAFRSIVVGGLGRIRGK